MLPPAVLIPANPHFPQAAGQSSPGRSCFSTAHTGHQHIFSLGCWGGYSVGTMEIARDGQLCAQTPHPIHLFTSIILFSVSAAPVGHTYRHRQSFVHKRMFLTAIFFILPAPFPPLSFSSLAPYIRDKAQERIAYVNKTTDITNINICVLQQRIPFLFIPL